MQTADLAFLLKPTPEEPEAARLLAWVRAQHAAGKRVLAVNANYLHAATNPTFALALKTFRARLAAKGVAVLLVPGAGTPAGGLAYQGKFEGMLRLFGLDDSGLLMSPEQFAADPDAAVDLAMTILDRRVALREQIATRLPAVLALSAENFAQAA